MLRVRNYSAIYENNRTKELKTLKWIPLPIKLDSDGYCSIMEEEDGPAIFGAWIACLEVVAKTRGDFVRSNGDIHTSSSLSRMTRIDKAVIERMVFVCIGLGWLENAGCDNPAGIPQEGATIPQEGAALLCNVMLCNVMSCNVPVLSFSESINSARGESEKQMPVAVQESWNSRFHEFLTAGPKCWLNWEQMAFDAWKYLRNSDPTVSADDIIASAIAFKQAKELDKTESRYITRPHNFLASGAYKTDWGAVRLTSQVSTAPTYLPGEEPF